MGNKIRYLMWTPCGEVSLLSEEAWRLVRNPSYKMLMGDWEAAMLIRQARQAWHGRRTKGRFRFAPSPTLSSAFSRLLGHEVAYITITDDAIRHIKKHHGMANERLRGQIPITPEDIGTIPYVMNNLDIIMLDPKHDDVKGNRSIEIRKKINGTTVIGTIERGTVGEIVVTMWRFAGNTQKNPGVSVALDAGSFTKPSKTSGPNVLNDTESVPGKDSFAKVKKDIEIIKCSADDSDILINSTGEPDVRHVVAVDDLYRLSALGVTRHDIAVLLRDGHLPLNIRASLALGGTKDGARHYAVRNGHAVIVDADAVMTLDDLEKAMKNRALNITSPPCAIDRRIYVTPRAAVAARLEQTPRLR